MGWVIWDTLEGKLHFKVQKVLTHSEWDWEFSVSPCSSLSQVHLQSNKRCFAYTQVPAGQPEKYFFLYRNSRAWWLNKLLSVLLVKSVFHAFIHDIKLQMSIFPSLSFRWLHAALAMSLKNTVQRDEIMHIYTSVAWVGESQYQIYFLDIWREFK